MEITNSSEGLTMNEPNVEFDEFRVVKSCMGEPCIICNHEYCGSCPDCSPEVPEWTS